MTVSALSLRSARSSRGGDACAAGADGNSQLSSVLDRVAWLEEQFAGAQREESESAGRCARLTEQLERLWQELREERRQRQAAPLGECERLTQQTFREGNENQNPISGNQPEANKAAASALEAAAAARQAEAQLKLVTAEAHRVEVIVRSEIKSSISEARVFLEQDFAKHSTVHTTYGSVAGSQHETVATTECIGVRLEALDLHFRARLEAVEDALSSRCEALSRTLEDRLCEGRERLEGALQEAKIATEATIASQIDVERVARTRAFEEERSRASERQQALAKAFGEEFEASVVSQALAEVRTAARAVAREEAVTAAHDSVADIQRQVTELASRIEETAPPTRASLSGPPTRLASVEVPAGEAPPASEAENNSADSAAVLRQFGESVMVLESNISNLLQSSAETRTEQKKEHAALQSEVELVRSQWLQLTSKEMPQIREHLQQLEASHRAIVENANDRPPCSGERSPSRGAVPHWRLAVVPSPSRSPSCGQAPTSPTCPPPGTLMLGPPRSTGRSSSWSTRSQDYSGIGRHTAVLERSAKETA